MMDDMGGLRYAQTTGTKDTGRCVPSLWPSNVGPESLRSGAPSRIAQVFQG